jgi:hypothetical protein
MTGVTPRYGVTPVSYLKSSDRNGLFLLEDNGLKCGQSINEVNLFNVVNVNLSSREYFITLFSFNTLTTFKLTERLFSRRLPTCHRRQVGR